MQLAELILNDHTLATWSSLVDDMIYMHEHLFVYSSIFDLEIALVYPVAVSLNAVGNYGF